MLNNKCISPYTLILLLLLRPSFVKSYISIVLFLVINKFGISSLVKKHLMQLFIDVDFLILLN